MIFVFLAVVVVARVLYLQIGPESEELRSQIDKTTFSRLPVQAGRGDILSQDGKILATSVPTYEIRMDVGADGLTDSIFHAGVDSLAYALSGFFGDRSPAVYRAKLMAARADKAKNRYLALSPRRVNYLEMKQISQFPLFRRGQNKGGFLAPSTNRRIYPYGSLALRTIGGYNQTGDKWGIEGAFDHELKGTDGNTVKQKLAAGVWIPVPDPESVEPVNGRDVVTTIDADIQDVAESAMRRQLENAGARWGSVIVMEVATGEIRAIVNLTRNGDGSIVEKYNYAIGTALEPGSTFKLVSLIALLEQGMELDEIFHTNDGDTTMHGAHVVDTHAYGTQDLKGCFTVSSNVGFAMAVNKQFGGHNERFIEQVKKTGITQKLDLQIEGEAPTYLKDPKDRSYGGWDGTTLTRMSYGYALKITPLQTLSLYNAVANNGKMMRPLLVSELREFGQPVVRYKPEVLQGSICSRSTVNKVQECLLSVVEEKKGTGGILRNPNYTVAAKTGTAQVAFDDGGYIDQHRGRKYLATMAGYFPADKPKYSCIVVMETYYGRGLYREYYGATLSGPVFRAVADRVFAAHTEWTRPQQGGVVPVPPVMGGNAKEIRTVATKLSLPIETPRRDEWIAIQPDSATVKGVSAQPVPGVVPDVRGMGLKEAIYLLERQGLTVAFQGRGKVEEQSQAPGSKAVRGSVIEIKLN